MHLNCLAKAFTLFKINECVQSINFKMEIEIENVGPFGMVAGTGERTRESESVKQ